MPLEIEIKLQTPHDPVREKLKSLHARYVGKVRETNIFFDRNGELRAKDSGLRVRFTQRLTDPHNPNPALSDGAGHANPTTQTALLTFKGPAAAAGLHSREALDLTLSPPDQLIPLLHALGFQQILLFEKDRESWELDGCKIELDTMPVFGPFVEIEGPDEPTVQAVQSSLNLSTIPQHKTSYSKMVSDHLKPSGQTELHL